MIDTDTLIYLIKNRPVSIAERFDSLDEDDTVCMSFISFAELLKGAEGSTRKPEVLRRLAALTRQLPVEYRVSARMCEHYAVQSVRLRKLGKPIGGNDLWIAAHALAEGATLITNNRAEFDRIDGLSIDNWVG